MASTRISDIRGPQGLPSTVPGPQGAPGVNAIPADSFIADRITTPGTATEGALAAKIATATAGLPDESDVAALVSRNDQIEAVRDVLNGRVPLGTASPAPTVTFGLRWGLSVTASIVNGGSGYVVGDEITLSGGSATVPAILRVATQTGGGVGSLTVVRSGVYTASPGSATFTQASTTGAGTGLQVTGNWSAAPGALRIADRTNVGPTSPLFRFTGNGPSNINSSGGYGNTVGNSTASIWEWETDAPFIEINMLAFNTKAMLYVDDRRLTDVDYTTDSSAGRVQMSLDHGGVTRMRRYRLFMVNGLFQGVAYLTAGNTFRAPIIRRKLAWGLGDSYMFGSGADVLSQSAFGVMCEQLGIDGLSDGIGSAGWTGSTGGTPVERINAKLATLTRAPDLIVWDLGFNNAASSLSAVTDGMQAAIVRAKELFPAAQHIAFGPATPVGETAQLLALKNAMRAEYDEHGIEMVDVADWVNADNKAMYTGTDNTHPTSLGHKMLGARKAAAARPHLVLI